MPIAASWTTPKRVRTGLWETLRVVLPAALLVSGAASGCLAPEVEHNEYECTPEDGLALYERRIEPLFADDHPASCNQCHLSGVDLELFVREDPCDTIGCLMQLGLVDFENVDNSLILTWIARAQPESELITEDVIAAEYDGFRQWLGYQARCGAAVCGTVSCPDYREPETCDVALEPFDEPTLDYTQGCSDRELEQLFGETVYRWRGRCFPCHFEANPHAPEEAPAWIYTQGGCNLSALETMRELERGNYLDLDDPESSRLLMKPLAESMGGLEHGGHDKFTGPGDPAYVAFLTWIEQYAACKNP